MRYLELGWANSETLHIGNVWLGVLMEELFI